VLANLLAMPIVSGWVMPMGILGVVTIPFGFDGVFWRQMGYGIEWMDLVALWVAGLPGAFGRVASFGTGPLLLATAGLLLICLLKTPLRWSRLFFVALSIGLALRAPLPDVVVAADGRTVAVRGVNGKLSFHRTGSDAFAMREWLAADADGRDVTDRGLWEGIACDSAGCIGKLPDRRLVSYALAPEALEEDCHRAAVVVAATHAAPPDCAALVVSRELWRTRGALLLRRDGKDGFVIDAARPENFDRPWAPRPSRTVSGANSESEVSPAADHTVPRDATPKPEDLQADD
jgi:competence protein ComEC